MKKKSDSQKEAKPSSPGASPKSESHPKRKTAPRKKKTSTETALSDVSTAPDENSGVLQDLLVDLVSKIPTSRESENDDPLSRSREIARNAALRAASVSGVLALPPGPLGMAAILPDLLEVWRIQKQLVADIAAAYGKSALLTKEMMVFCLFKHGAAMLMRDIAVRAGQRLLVRRVTLRTLQSALRKIGVRITQKVIAKSIAKYVPFVGAVAIGGYAYYDTSKVAATAIDAFSGEISLEGDSPEE